jgi:hypothetical protein
VLCDGEVLGVVLRLFWGRKEDVASGGGPRGYVKCVAVWIWVCLVACFWEELLGRACGKSLWEEGKEAGEHRRLWGRRLTV